MANAKRAQVDRSSARIYYGKAKQLCDAASDALDAQRHDATVVLAIHAGISACDSVTIGLAGLRSTDADHERAADLVRTVGRGAFDDDASRLLRLLRLKNRIEYDNKRATADDAEQSAKRCAALVKWADTELVKARL